MPAGPSVVIDRETCIGSGICVMYAPEKFAHDDEAKAYVVDAVDLSPEVLADVVEACPTGAIRLVTKEADA